MTGCRSMHPGRGAARQSDLIQKNEEANGISFGPDWGSKEKEFKFTIGEESKFG